MSQSRLVLVLSLVTALSVGAAGAQLLVPPVQAQPVPAAAIARWEHYCAPMQKEGMRIAGERGWEMVAAYPVTATSTTNGTNTTYRWEARSEHRSNVTYCFKRPLP
jgi:hypothetical protein